MLRHILLLQRDVPRAAKFYSEGLGLEVKVLTERWAELDCGGSTLALKAVEGYGNSLLLKTQLFPTIPIVCDARLQGGTLHDRVQSFSVFHCQRSSRRNYKHAAARRSHGWRNQTHISWKG